MRERCACGAEVEVEDEHVAMGSRDHPVVIEWRARHALVCTQRQPNYSSKQYTAAWEVVG